jgi:simple sugar transport system permease protein
MQPSAPRLEAVPLADWAGNDTIAQALQVNPLFFVGVALAVFLSWAFANTRWGLILRMTGDSAASARAMGVNIDLVRLLATAAGGFLAGVGGAFLSLYYPGS